MDKSRQQFEAVLIRRKLSTEKKKNKQGVDDYKYSLIQMMWEGWQESRDNLEIEMPKPIQMHGNWYFNADIVIRKLISNGVKIKNGN